MIYEYGKALDLNDRHGAAVRGATFVASFDEAARCGGVLALVPS
jgi:hypothetical protein